MILLTWARVCGNSTVMHSKVASDFCILVLSASSAFAADIPDYPFVYVVGKADTDTPPNIAICSLTLRARDPDANKAAATVEERLKSVLGHAWSSASHRPGRHRII